MFNYPQNTTKEARGISLAVSHFSYLATMNVTNPVDLNKLKIQHTKTITQTKATEYRRSRTNFMTRNQALLMVNTDEQ